ncbi:hypothetical protein PLESTM_000561000 [Pleodorina starrii]|nr:hypothetical protein PLESTM_000561000 [Pleodorina starrii]
MSKRVLPCSLLSALDKQVAGTADADAAALDDDLVRHLLRSNSAAAHGEALDTLRLLRRSNAGLPGLRGQTILAKVLNVNAKRILVDPGFTALSEVPRDEVSIAHVHTSDGQLPDGRLSTSDIRPGDLLRLRVDCVYTPYGDMQLTAVKGDVEQQRRLIWGELRRAMEQRRPVAGRVLNECPGGFAVGVAGFVAVLPAALAATATTRAVGVAQEFTIMAMDDARQRITLRDPRLQRLSR